MIKRDTSFWVVITPTKDSTLADICFECKNLHEYHLQVLGGLSADQVEQIYKHEHSAMKLAKKLLAEFELTNKQ